MAIQNRHTDISVTEFKHRCLEIIRRVEESGKPVAITRGGKVVARLNPSASSIGPGRLKPWERWLTPDSPLPRVEREALDVKADRRELFMSAISLWEVQVLYARKRLDLPLPFPDWLARAADDRMIIRDTTQRRGGARPRCAPGVVSR